MSTLPRYYAEGCIVRDRVQQGQAVAFTQDGEQDGRRMSVVIAWLLNAADDFKKLHEVATTVDPQINDLLWLPPDAATSLISASSTLQQEAIHWLNKPR